MLDSVKPIQRDLDPETSKERLLQDQIITQQKKMKVIIISDSMIKKTDGYLLTSSIYCKSKQPNLYIC